MVDVQNWTNENAGLLSLIIFLATVAISLFVWSFKKVTKDTAKLKIEVIKTPTFCSSFDSNEKNKHRTAFMLYLKITNIGTKPVQIGDIHIGYKSEQSDSLEDLYWLTSETTMIEDYFLDFGNDKIKVIPFLKQQNQVLTKTPKTYLLEGEDTNGIVYFEQEKSDGKNYPYMDEDFGVYTEIVVHDTKGGSWSISYQVPKVRIEAIRKLNPNFGLSREYNESIEKYQENT